MPLETELKLRVESHEPVRARLPALGAAFAGRVRETNEIFDRPDGSLRRQGHGLRIRSVRAEDGDPPPATLTWKGPRLPGPMKSREELEVRIGEPETAARLLQMLGFVRVLRYEKRRESWTLGDCRVELDEPPHLGLFVEIEGPDEETIRAVRDQLGLDGAAQIQSSYVRMLAEFCEKRGMVDRVLTLP